MTNALRVLEAQLQAAASDVERAASQGNGLQVVLTYNPTSPRQQRPKLTVYYATGQLTETPRDR